MKTSKTPYSNVHCFIVDFEQKNPKSPFFSKETMKFFKDTVSNFQLGTGKTTDENGEVIELFVLRRKKLKEPCIRRYCFFRKDNLKVAHYDENDVIID